MNTQTQLQSTISMTSLNAINELISKLKKQKKIEDQVFLLTKHKLKRQDSHDLKNIAEEWEKKQDDNIRAILESREHERTSNFWTKERLDYLFENKFYFQRLRTRLNKEKQEKSIDAYDDITIQHQPSSMEMELLFQWFNYLFPHTDQN